MHAAIRSLVLSQCAAPVGLRWFCTCPGMVADTRYKRLIP